MMGSRSRIQSAMEYLMSYGWSILIIVIILGILYYLGLFGGNASTASNTCLATVGFFCSSPILNTTGNVVVTIGQDSGSPITIIGLACTNTSTGPSGTVAISDTVVPSGGKTSMLFQCPGAAGPISSPHIGYLWISYDTGTHTALISQIGTFSARVTTYSPIYASSNSLQAQFALCGHSGSLGSNTLSTNSICSLYFCVGANYAGYEMTSYSWSSDVVPRDSFSASGSQTSNTCTVTDSGASYQGLGIIGFNGIESGEYSIINNPTTFNAVYGFSSDYILTSTSNVLILVGCGDDTCSVTAPSGCTTETSEDSEAYTYYCQSEASGSYSVSSTGGYYTSVEVALLSGSSSQAPALSVSFSDGTSPDYGVSDTANGITSFAGDSVSLEDCYGSCTPSNVLSTGTASTTYNTNTLGVGTYTFDVCDTTENICSEKYTVSIGNPASLSFSSSPDITYGSSDTATGTTTKSGDSVSIKDCSGSSCTPSNVLSTGTASTTYNVNTLAPGSYVFDACDTAVNECSATQSVTVTNPVSLTMSNGTIITVGTNDTASGSTIDNDQISIEDCIGSGCTPSTTVASGTNSITYNLDSLAVDTYEFDACDATLNVCSSSTLVEVLNSNTCVSTTYTDYNGIASNTAAISYTLYGGGGGGGGGIGETGTSGSEATGTFNILSGNALTIYVGGGGGGGVWCNGGGGGGGSGYYGGGGGGECYGGGGGSSAILSNGNLVTYADGGAGYGNSDGGTGGSDVGGAAGSNPEGTAPTAGSAGVGGAGGYCGTCSDGGGGGGGGGYGAGGGGGGGGSCTGQTGGGGGNGATGGTGGTGTSCGNGGNGGSNGANGAAGVSHSYSGGSGGIGGGNGSGGNGWLSSDGAGGGGNGGIAVIMWTEIGGSCGLSSA